MSEFKLVAGLRTTNDRRWNKKANGHTSYWSQLKKKNKKKQEVSFAAKENTVADYAATAEVTDKA